MNNRSGKAAVLVSVLCYNHDKYIRQCLDSIFEQKCNFPFKVFVFDDVSTDDSWNIILEYKKRYREQMIVYRPDQNQFSQGKLNTYKKMVHSMSGYKYIAICEGDDYWSSPFKLQKQYDGMEKNDSCSICVCSTDSYDEINQKFMGRVPAKCRDEVIDGDKVIIDALKRSLSFGANTFFMRNKYLVNMNMDTKFWNYLAGDVSYIMYLATQGKVLYLGDCMAVKRRYNKGSVSEKVMKNEMDSDYFSEDIEWAFSFNAMTERKYEDSIRRYIIWRKIRSYYLKNGEVMLSKCVNDSNGKAYKTELGRKINRLYIRCFSLIYGNEESRFIKKERQWMEKEWKIIQKKERLRGY